MNACARSFAVSFCLLATVLLPLSAAAQQRAALIIGCDYKGTNLELPSPVRDARAVAAKLPRVGFAAADIALVENPTLKEFTDAVDSFSRKLAAGKGAGIFYFSGHGAQVDGENYLIPGGASVKFREHLKTQGMAASYIATSMEGAKNGINILILDACRSNDLPSASSKNAFKKGFSQMDGDGILFCFAARDGQEALDTGSGSVYTNTLLKHLATPGVGVFDMLTRVRRDVKALTEGKQEPFIYSGLDQSFSFVPELVDPTHDAIEAFKVDMLKMQAWCDENAKGIDSEANPIAALALIKSLAAKMSEVKTDGLPADLKTAYTAVPATLVEMARLLKGMPSKPKEMQAWLVRQDANFQAKLKKLGTELTSATEKFGAVSNKYDVDLPGMIKKQG